MARAGAWLLLLLLPLTACSSPQLRLYEGPARAAAEVAVVTMPEQLEVAQLNGAELPGAKGLWLRGDKRLELLPGTYELLVFYRELWDQGSDQVLRSDPARFVIEAQAGGRYRIDYQRPANLREAQQLEAAFQGWVDDGHGHRQPSQPSALAFRRDWAAPLGHGDELTAGATASAPVQELPYMQAWWKQASAQQRREFLQWIATQP